MNRQATLFDLDRPAPAREPMPPHVAAPTSREAAESVREHVSRLRAIVLNAFKAAASRGLTCDELEQETGLSHQCASPRQIELARLGLIVEARDGEGNVMRRKTRSGRPAAVWITRED